MAVPYPADAGITFEPYRKDVYLWAFRVLGSHHDALDMVQDVFLRWLSQTRRALPDNPRAWLRRTTINGAIDLIRSKERRAESIDLSLAPASPTNRSEPEKRELRAHVADAINRLTEMQRSVLAAKEYDGLTFARIAEEFGIAVPTVKTHYLRALKAMRDSLSGRWDPERNR